MSYIVTILDREYETIKQEDVNDVSFVGEFMILCMSDMKTRYVYPLSMMLQYKIVEQPIVKAKKEVKK